MNGVSGGPPGSFYSNGQQPNHQQMQQQQQQQQQQQMMMQQQQIQQQNLYQQPQAQASYGAQPSQVHAQQQPIQQQQQQQNYNQYQQGQQPQLQGQVQQQQQQQQQYNQIPPGVAVATSQQQMQQPIVGPNVNGQQPPPPAQQKPGGVSGQIQPAEATTGNDGSTPGASSQAQQTAETAARMASTAAEGARQKIKGLFGTGGDTAGPNIGFKPTAALAQRHEDALVSGKRPLFQFQVTKLRNWRTGYTRLLCLYDDHFSTVDPDSHQITNTWNYSLLADFAALDKDQIVLQVKSDKLKFQCHNVDRSVVLSAILQCIDDQQQQIQQQQNITPGNEAAIVLCNRWTRHGHVVPAALRLTSFALVEVHPVTRKVVQSYRYVDVDAVSFLSDDPTGVVVHIKTTKKKRLFAVANQSIRTDLVMGMRRQMDRIGLELKMTDSSTLQQWKDGRLEEQKQSSRKNKVSSVIATEWHVSKQSKRHDAAVVGTTNGWPGGIVSRRLCLAGNGELLEMDTNGMIVSTRQLSSLYAIVRPSKEGDSIILEYSDGHSQQYASQSRDSLMVSLIDATTTIGKNPRVQVSDVRSGGYCLASFSTLAMPEKSGGLFQPISIPLHCLKRVHTVGTAAFSYMNSNTESSTEEGVPINPVDECRNVMEICREFNASVLPTAEGLPTGEKDKLVLGSIGSLWGLVAWLLEWQKDRHAAEQTAGPLLQTLHRLSKTPAGYKNTIELATFLDCVPLLLTIKDAFTKFWAFRTMTILLSGVSGSRDKEVEYVNKSVIFQAGGVRFVHDLVMTLVDLRASDLIRMVLSDIFQSILCSYADTTSPELFSAFISALGQNYQALLNTLYQQTPFVLENSALLLHLLSTHAPSVASSIREAALASGVLLYHFHAAIFSPMSGQRFLSRFLCSLWLAGPLQCDEKKLLKRMVPSGFIPYLKMPQLSRTEEEQLDVIEQDAVEQNIPEDIDSDGSSAGMLIAGSAQPTGAAGTNTARLRSRISLSRATSQGDQTRAPENFRIFFHTLTQDHSLPDLIWNQQTRRELRIGLESEIQYIHRETDARGIDKIAWNHQQFSVEYPSLENELRVGSIYMRLWLQAGEGFIKSWDEPVRLFELLFRRFLCEMDRNAKVTVMCIRCLERLYAIHGDSIGAFPDVMILIRSMASTRSRETQHRLLGLVATILGVDRDSAGDESRVNVPENAEQLLNFESIEQLCQFAAWGHTNGVQVGNLMTSLLEDSLPKSAMITDGNTERPSGSGGTSDQSKSAGPQGKDSSPPVWFVSSTYKIPPPPEAVKGPYRLKELRSMMESEEISPFTLVTSTHVISYDEDDRPAEESASEIQIDTGKWKRLDQIWQLRWQLCSDKDDSGIFTASEVALQALRSLTRLVDLHRSVNSLGLPYLPIPIAKRIICGLGNDPFLGKNGESSISRLSFLSIIAQSILCNDASVVDEAAALLLKLMQHNEEASSKLYTTGVFFFAACYTGSNFRALAKLMYETHLSQHFRSGYAAAADKNELPLKDRSILGNLVPEGVLHVLVNYGADKFNEIFVGNFDTPEVIWNLEMRKHLIEMVRQHLGDFPKRLWQNTTTEYEYCPMPGVAYKRLEKELFCHKYYLSNLCNESRFPDWPISEPVEVFRSCLEQFKKQMNRDETEEEEAMEQATKILNLKPGDGSKALRKMYRKLALQYHPDRNPAGREMFEAIQGSYELLLPIIESGQELKFSAAEAQSGSSSGSQVRSSDASEGFRGGRSQMETLQLLIKAQILICKRFEEDMGKYKYPAYSLLLSCLQLTGSSKGSRSDDNPISLFRSPFLTEKRALFVRDAVELTFRTCLVSPLNAEELVSENGVVILDEILDFYMHSASLLDQVPEDANNIASDEVVYQIIANVVHTLAGVAYYESGRIAIENLASLDRFCINWRRCVDGNFLKWRDVQPKTGASITQYALEGLSSMARVSVLQNSLVGAGILWPLGRFLLAFDPTLDEASVSRDNLDDDVGVSQASNNAHGRLAARALGMLSGSLSDQKLATPVNTDLKAALSTMLTPPIAMLLRNKRTGEILRMLNSNVETPSRIWNIEMRSELMNLITRSEKARPEKKVQSIETELSSISSFHYSALKNEMQISSGAYVTYVRVFNKLGQKGVKDVSDPKAFAVQLTNYVAACINESGALRDVSTPLPVEKIDGTALPSLVSITERSFIMALTALQILTRSEGLIEDILSHGESTGLPSVFLSLLDMPQDSEAFDIGSDILSSLSSKQCFADAVTSCGAIWRLLDILERPSQSQQADSDRDDAGETATDMIRKRRGWELMEALSSTPSVANLIVTSCAWLELLGIVVGYVSFTRVWAARTGAAKTLSRLLWEPQTSPLLAPLLQRFLPSTLVVILKDEGPETMLKRFDGESDTPELIWGSSMRTELQRVVGTELSRCLESRESFVLDPAASVTYKEVKDELFIGGVYLARFIKEPTFALRDPTSFLEKTLQQWAHQINLLTTQPEPVSNDTSSTDVIAVGQKDSLQMITDAVALNLKLRTNLLGKLSEWGYISKCLSLLQETLDRDLLGTPLVSVMRILHVAVNSRTNVESLISSGQNDTTNGIVAFTKRAVGASNLHPDTAFMLEMLKKVFADALGDLKKAKEMNTRQTLPGLNSQQATAHYAMAHAPSPAPGDGYVRRSRVTTGNPLDDPLAAMGGGGANPSVAQSGSAASPSMYAQVNHQQPQFAHQQYQQQQNFSQQQSSISSHQLQQNQNSYQQPPPQQQPSVHFPGQYNPAMNSYGFQGQPALATQPQTQYPARQTATTGSQPQQQNAYGVRTAAPSAAQPQMSFAQRSVMAHQQMPGAQQNPQRPSMPPTQQVYPHFQSPQPVQQQQQQQQPQHGNHYSGQMNTGFVQQQPRTVSYNISQNTTAMPGTSSPSFAPQPATTQVASNPQTAAPIAAMPSSSFVHQPTSGHMMPQNPQQQTAPVAPPQNTSIPQTHLGSGMHPSSFQPNVHQQGQGLNNSPHSLPHVPADPNSQFAATNNMGQLPEGLIPPNPSPQVETVTEGTGIDARSKPEPSVEAAQKAATSSGAPGCANGRKALLESALRCDLPNYLVESVLENSSLSRVKDPAAAKVHAVELLKLLSQDPGYGMKITMILDDLPAWKKYVTQDHSLFITGPEQKSDYFLTDGGSDPKKLLTQGPSS